MDPFLRCKNNFISKILEYTIPLFPYRINLTGSETSGPKTYFNVMKN